IILSDHGKRLLIGTMGSRRERKGVLDRYFGRSGLAGKCFLVRSSRRKPELIYSKVVFAVTAEKTSKHKRAILIAHPFFSPNFASRTTLTYPHDIFLSLNVTRLTYMTVKAGDVFKLGLTRLGLEPYPWLGSVRDL